MKKILTLVVTAVTLAAFASTTFAEGGCGGCPVSGEKGKDKDKKAEEGTQS